ncbi:hypothetical protein ACIHEJ_28135 [Streptomyces sp. NPDC052301]|uniref:hypothetical protein n=1 Tax=Streptomyces sp. NPDC052301 TaxID=3365687 RepID=UPI0037D6E753
MSSYGDGTENGLVTRSVYAYTDAHGERRECRDTGLGAERVEILYDPVDPDGSSQVGRGTTAMFVLGVVLLLVFGLPLVPTGAVTAVFTVALPFL